MSKTVIRRVDLTQPPVLNDQQKAQIEALNALPDDTIDYSDIAPLDEAFWQHAVRNPYYKPVKVATTVRVDSDVLMWLKQQGKGYQTRLNAILRDAMLRATLPATRAQKTGHA